ncbi:unnamed protein product, partial [Rotaria magnacalcarata]|jgi:hypothetical protein
MQF